MAGCRSGCPITNIPIFPTRTWHPNDIINNYSFNPNSDDIDINLDWFEVLGNGTPIDSYKLIVNDTIIIKIIEETNNYSQ